MLNYIYCSEVFSLQGCGCRFFGCELHLVHKRLGCNCGLLTMVVGQDKYLQSRALLSQRKKSKMGGKSLKYKEKCSYCSIGLTNNLNV